MHISRRSIFAFLISTVLAASPAAAQGRGGSAPKTHPVKTTSAGTHTSGPKTSPTPKPPAGPKASPAPKAHGGGNTAKAPKTPTPTTTASATKTTKTPNSTNTTTTTPTSTTTTPTVTLTPVQEKLQKNTNLASKLESRLPKGTDLMLAAEGFRNLGQFVAAVNVSNNLDIPFTALKTSMVDDGLSLGQSIKKLRPLADATHEASLAESQATTILNSTTTTTTTSTSTKTKKRTGSSQE